MDEFDLGGVGMTERRRFNGSEHIALYLAADGKCSQCGVDLQPGWHADHIQAYARGGATDVINGQALCPTCNLMKGNRVTPQLREWQSQALTDLDRHDGDFLAVATPGAGKTTFALTAAATMLTDDIEFIIVVVPTSHLRRQWAKAAHRMGISLDSSYTNGSGALAPDYDGVVTTYAAIASQSSLWRRHASRKRTLVILDEVHHAGDADHLTWGPALREAFEPAVRRILLSGTPFRSDGRAIPFVAYDDQGRCIPSYNYDYGEAIRDGGVVRPTEFLALNSQVKWRNAGSVERSSEVRSIQLDAANDDEVSKALVAALDPDGDWIPSVLRQANTELNRQREEVPDAAGLVIARDQLTARRYAAILANISGEPPTVALSDDAEASKKIEAFASSESKWIVAVRMVSEGVDIPRLLVGVYATNTRSKMFVQQVVGRFVRKRGIDDESSATLFIPSIQPLLRIAAEIERNVDEAMLREVEEARERSKREGSSTTLFDIVQPLSATPAEHYATIRSGESYPDAELKRAEELARQQGFPSSVSFAQVAALLRAAGTPQIVGTVQVSMPEPEKPMKSDDKAAQRKICKRLVGRLSGLTGAEHAHVNQELNSRLGLRSINQATSEQLDRRIELLHQWISEAQL